MTAIAMATWKHRGILSVDDNAVGETTVDATWRQIKALDTKGVEAGVIVDTTDCDIEIAASGDYQVTAALSFSGTGNKTYYVQIYKDTTGTGFEVKRKLGASGDVGSCGVLGIISCVAGEKISLYQKSSDGGTAMVISHAQLSVVRLS